MKFTVPEAIEILERTPSVLDKLLTGTSDNWTLSKEGENLWSVYDVVGHLIHGEETDWVPRMRIILSDSKKKDFSPFDREAQFINSKGKNLSQLLNQFTSLRADNLEVLNSLNLTSSQLELTGTHPEFGTVRLDQLIATWAVHDLSHLAQITRIMAKQWNQEVGPWKQYLGVLKRK